VNVDLTADQVAIAVEGLLPKAAPVRPLETLRAGRSHSSWVFASALGRVVGKVKTTDSTQLAVERLEEHRRVAEHGVPVPRLLDFTSSSGALGGRLLVVAEYLEGHDAAATHPASTMADVLRSAGAALAELHQVPVPAFGDPLTGVRQGPASWGEVISGRVELLHRAYRRQDFDSVTKSLIEAGLLLLDRLGSDVSSSVRPAVAHLDVYLPNILVDAAGRFRALLDLEHLRWVDPAMDFVKPAMWMFEENPEWTDAFAEGYGLAASPSCWLERVSVAAGLELLTGVDYWTRVKDREMRADYLRRLRSWVRSDGARHVWPPMR
jgi:aminoglycoside phosphotransferase (APT) family kinase protein